jgi:predicted HTH domain antitoxin
LATRLDMIVPLPADLESRFTPAEMRLQLAIGMFIDRRVTLGQGAEIAGLSQSTFLHELGKRQIPMHYDEADAHEDIEAARRWSQKC